MRRVKVRVTDFELKNGAPRNKVFCPIALALWTLLPGHIEVLEDGSVHVYSVRWAMVPIGSGRVQVRKCIPSKPLAALMLPQPAIRWLEAYDALSKGNPAEFEMDLPEIKIGDAYEREVDHPGQRRLRDL